MVLACSASGYSFNLALVWFRARRLHREFGSSAIGRRLRRTLRSAPDRMRVSYTFDRSGCAHHFSCRSPWLCARITRTSRNGFLVRYPGDSPWLHPCHGGKPADCRDVGYRFALYLGAHTTHCDGRWLCNRESEPSENSCLGAVAARLRLHQFRTNYTVAMLG